METSNDGCLRTRSQAEPDPCVAEAGDFLGETMVELGLSAMLPSIHNLSLSVRYIETLLVTAQITSVLIRLKTTPEVS